MFIVPTDTPGVEIVRNVGIGIEHRGDASHAYIRYDDVRVPADHLLGKEGSAFVIAQTRLGGGRIHHAMRTVAQLRKAFDMMCERALSRETQGEKLAEKQMVQEQIADSLDRDRAVPAAGAAHRLADRQATRTTSGCARTSPR